MTTVDDARLVPPTPAHLMRWNRVPSQFGRFHPVIAKIQGLKRPFFLCHSRRANSGSAGSGRVTVT